MRCFKKIKKIGPVSLTYHLHMRAEPYTNG